ncbi:hypothetical protein MUP95_02660 [bacterium]|nr:hypothetical protein [bacterium]
MGNLHKKQPTKKMEKITPLDRRKTKYIIKPTPASFTIFLCTFIFAILCLTTCDRDFSPLEIIQEVILTVTDSTATADREVKITNHTERIIYVPYIHYRVCHFFIYELEQELESGQFDTLWYHSYGSVGGKWLTERNPTQVICLEEKRPVQLEPSQSFTQKISGLEPGKYRITVYYSYSEEALFDYRPWKDHFVNPSEWFILREQFTLN